MWEFGFQEDNNLIRTYTAGPGIDNWLSFTGHITTNTYYYITDHVGTVHAVTDSSGAVIESYRYSPYGKVLDVFDENGNTISQSAIGNRILFQGREYDWDTGFYYFRARWYDPDTGRWLSKDPIGINGGLNQYVFCGNNPIMFIDPLGLWQITLGFGYGYAGRITFGHNSNRWNIGFGFGYGIGATVSGTSQNIEPGYASQGVALNIGIEASGQAKVFGLVDVSGGLRVFSEADGCDNIETRGGVFGSVRIPGTIVNVGGTVDVVSRGNLEYGTAEYIIGDVQPKPVETGLGGMAFVGVTGGVNW